MCDLGHHHNLHHAPTGHDEYLTDGPLLREFIDQVKQAMTTAPGRETLVEVLKPAFSGMLADKTWLPERFQAPCIGAGMGKGMGGGIGQYLIYRSGDGGLTLFSLAVPPGSRTPIHDRLAWGLVGLYKGEQSEEVYDRVDDGDVENFARLKLTQSNHLCEGEFYTLLPPTGDIHAVQTVSEAQSVSLHLLGNDAGCIWRHSYQPEKDLVTAFRSGYTNWMCEE